MHDLNFEVSIALDTTRIKGVTNRMTVAAFTSRSHALNYAATFEKSREAIVLDKTTGTRWGDFTDRPDSVRAKNYAILDKLTHARRRSPIFGDDA